MNNILIKIKQIINESIKEYIPLVKPSDLEENGTIYYMNGKNGTEFEWYVNEHLPSFMVFYNDEQNLGAVKLSLYKDGRVYVYIYEEKGNKLVKEIKTSIGVSENEVFQLAIILKNGADDNSVWDASIDKINTYIEVTDEKMAEFKKSEEYMQSIKNRMNLLNKTAYISNKILKDGWKVGYMNREEVLNENDSGWSFMAGDEDDEYLSDYKNVTLLSIYNIYQLDSDIWNYIDNPIGSKFIRISSNEFEIDKNNKKIYMEKRKV